MLRFALLTAVAVFLVALAVAAQEEPMPPAPGADELFVLDTFRIDTVVCPFKSSIDYEPGEIECGLLQVPENRENPDSRFIELHYIKLNAQIDEDGEDDGEHGYDLEPGKRDDPIVYLTGGPGAHATYYVKRFKDHGIRKHRDMYILEQRGIGFSGDFCPFYATRKPEVGDAETFEEHLEAGLIAAEDCARNAVANGVDLGGYHSFENARDVKALRIALGYEQWNVWGISYGSILGQAYLKVDPEGIRAIALDAIVPLDIRGNSWAWRSVQWYDRDLQKLDELCRAQPDCAKRYANLGERIREATISVQDNPIVVEVDDVERFPSGTAAIFTDVVAFLPFTFLYEQSHYPAMPALIHAWADAVERRDETLFQAIASLSGSFFGGSQGMANAILCNDGDTEVQAIAGQQDIDEFPVLGGAIATAESYRRRVEMCADLGMAPRDASEYTAVETDIPALIIEGNMDPITPPPLAKAILPGFSNGTYVEFPYAGHGPSRSVECAGAMLNAFFDDPMADPDVRCVDEMERPEFYVPLYTTSLAPRLMVKAMNDKRSLAAPGIWLGSSALVSLIAFLVLTFAPVGRFFDRERSTPAFGARTSAWFSAFLATVTLVILGSATAVTFKAFKELLLFGLVPWARYGAWAGVLVGLLGIVTVVLTVRAQTKNKLPIGSLLGFLATGLAATALSAFLLFWDLGPF